MIYTLIELTEISNGDVTGIYWQVKFPFMMSNRDVSLLLESVQLNLLSCVFTLQFCYTATMAACRIFY